MQGLLNNHLNERKAAIAKAFGVTIVKSNMNDINKANKGEGSRGGKVIGHTKSGKPIYEGQIYHIKAKNSLGASIVGRARKGKHTDFEFHSGKKITGTSADYLEEGYDVKDASEGQKNKWTKNELKHHLNKNEEHFYSVVSKYYQPNDDGESEHTMLENLSKHKNVQKILTQLNKKK